MISFTSDNDTNTDSLVPSLVPSSPKTKQSSYTSSNLHTRHTKDLIESCDDDTDCEDETDFFNGPIDTVSKVNNNKGRGSSKEYSLIESFDTYLSALQHMKKNTDLTFRYPKETQEGQKRYYYCTGFIKCPCTIYLLKHPDSQECTLWSAICDHNHQQKTNNRLSTKTTRIVEQMIKDGIRSNKRINQRIKEMKLPQLKLSQINNLKARFKSNYFILKISNQY